MVAIALIVFGLISYKDLSIDLMPNVDFPVMTITTTFPGADPQTVETEVSKPIEESVGTLAGIKELMSYSEENVSLVVIQFELEVDSNVALQDVRDRISRIQDQFPANVKTPTVTKIDFQATPVVSVAISGAGTTQDLSDFVKNIVKPRLEQSSGVGQVNIVGLRERQVRIWLDPVLMSSYGVTAFDVVGALQRSNIKLPGGRVETGDREYLVVTSGELQSVQEFGNVVVANKNDHLVKLSDVARVEDGLADLRSLCRLNGQSAIGLQCVKQSGANTIDTADAVRANFADLQPEIPPGIKTAITADTSSFIRDSFEETRGHILGGGLRHHYRSVFPRKLPNNRDRRPHDPDQHHHDVHLHEDSRFYLEYPHHAGDRAVGRNVNRRCHCRSGKHIPSCGRGRESARCRKAQREGKSRTPSWPPRFPSLPCLSRSPS